MFPSNGQNHKNAVKSEEELDFYTKDLERIYSKSISEIEHKGGTKHKEDNVILFMNGDKRKISLKLKAKGLKEGSLDYVNTSNFDSSIKHNSQLIYEKYRSMKDVKYYELLKQSIHNDLDNISNEFITKFFNKNVLEKYKDIDLILIDNPTKTIYKVYPKVFELLENGGMLSVNPTKRKCSNSRSIVGLDKEGNEVEINLRVRLHLNNGKTKWLNGKSSQLVLKFQQDSVHKMI
tara:strand:- start:5487 stop:6188 length:702 start_codon:yes stop_codon:yes gene_type:complete